MTTRRLRLGEHVLARRHVIDGHESVVLHDTGGERIYALQPHQFTVLAMADGTRDPEGIVAAAGRYGVWLGAEAVAQFLGELDELGLCAEGPAPHHPEATQLGRDLVDIPPERPVVVLENYRFHCHGRGGCCRRYETIVCTPDDVARARAALPERSCGPVPIERLFVPLRGSAPSPLSTPTLRDGACCFLGEDGRCDIHRVAGSTAKPLGCSAFPVIAFDDGERVRISVSTECGCVFDSAKGSDGDPLVPTDVNSAADLPPTFAVARMPKLVRLTNDRTVSADEARRWQARWLADPWSTDIPTAVWCLADGLERGATVDDALGSDGNPFATLRLGRLLEALDDTVATWARIETSWRSANDQVRVAATAIATATTSLKLSFVHGSPPPAADPNDERFHLRAQIHGGRIFTKRPVATSLRDLAVRQWLARAIEPTAEASFDHPLAVVDACMRGHGLERYLRSAL